MITALTKPTSNGFTLIEVLIALAIIAVALLAIVKGNDTSIRNTQYLQQKTIALWVAHNAIAEIQLKLIYPPVSKRGTLWLGKKYFWSAVESKTPDKWVNKITVTVSAQKYGRTILTLQGFNSA